MPHTPAIHVQYCPRAYLPLSALPSESISIKHAAPLQDAGVTARRQLEFTTWRAVSMPLAGLPKCVEGAGQKEVSCAGQRVPARTARAAQGGFRVRGCELGTPTAGISVRGCLCVCARAHHSCGSGLSSSRAPAPARRSLCAPAGPAAHPADSNSSACAVEMLTVKKSQDTAWNHVLDTKGLSAAAPSKQLAYSIPFMLWSTRFPLMTLTI